MGDFVSSRKTTLETSADVLKPTLFPPPDPIEKILPKYSGDVSTSFSLYAAKPYGGELDGALEEWQLWQESRHEGRLK
jgi:hypothetical protein